MIHPPTDPDYLDQMPAREHLWRCSPEEQARCWCRPMPYDDQRLVRHRPDPGFVFWEHGEHGPHCEIWAHRSRSDYDPLAFEGVVLLTDPVLDDLDHIHETWGASPEGE